MNLLRFITDGGSPFLYAQAVSGYKVLRWTERHREAGELEIEAPLSSGLRDVLPPGTFVTHVDTKEVMIIEDHHIEQKKLEDPKLKITGRSLDSFLENRIVGAEYGFGTPAVPPTEYELPATADPGYQIVVFIADHCKAGVGGVIDSDDALPYTDVAYTPYIEATDALVLKRGSVYEALTDLLLQRDYGLKTVRDDLGIVDFHVHYGEDKSADVLFSWGLDELAALEYLFTNRKLKNTAYVMGRYASKMVYTGATYWDRRVMFVDASDLDSHLTAIPGGGTLTTIQNKMAARGMAALLGQVDLNMAQFDISPDSRYKYRVDYNLGDIVSIQGDFGDLELRRVTEYTEIEDENGETGHPTLSEIIILRA